MAILKEMVNNLQKQKSQQGKIQPQSNLKININEEIKKSLQEIVLETIFPLEEKIERLTTRNYNAVKIAKTKINKQITIKQANTETLQKEYYCIKNLTPETDSPNATEEMEIETYNNLPPLTNEGEKQQTKLNRSKEGENTWSMVVKKSTKKSSQPTKIETQTKHAHKHNKTYSSRIHSNKALLILPADNNTSSLQILEKSSINPHEFGIKRRIPFPSGAMLLQCSSEKQAETLKDKISTLTNLGIKGLPKPRIPEIRIHGVPTYVTIPEIMLAITTLTKKEPLTMIEVPYKATEKSNHKIIICKVNPTAYILGGANLVA